MRCVVHVQPAETPDRPARCLNAHAVHEPSSRASVDPVDMPEQAVAVDLGVLSARILAVGVAMQHRHAVPVQYTTAGTVGVHAGSVRPQLPHDRFVQVAAELTDHAGPVFLGADKAMVMVAEQQVSRLVFVDQVHARFNVGGHILVSFLIGAARAKESQVEHIAEMDAGIGPEVVDELSDERPCVSV